ncbi:hypothetical protein AAFF_G00334370 [Aldrovandia affinis]|uniref:Fork-head domain-containing protein n=1 Tax=Aldrovandia affinis TaxID=143900 RepID=A0AAD7SL12_9TELE|nr:hypothetical protein AAFF_G00334370 [Aldrovandia affinis]
MSGKEGERQGCGGTTRGRQQQQEEEEEEEEERVEQPGTICWHEGRSSLQPPAQSSTPQVSFPFLVGPGGRSLITASQLQVILLQQCGTRDGNKQILHFSQHRPSVLRRGTQTLPQDVSSVPASGLASDAAPTPVCKVEASEGQRGTSPQYTNHAPLRSSLKQSSSHTGQRDSAPHSRREGGSFLFVDGLCQWPGCEDEFQEYSGFLKHLSVAHRAGARSLSQWQAQRDVVQHMETQLTLEKQRLLAMQLHLHLPEPSAAYSEEEQSLVMSPPLSRADAHAPPQRAHREVQLLPQAYWHTPTPQSLPGIIPSIECYKYNNIRPPYTYAHLIRWAILESLEKQLTLSEIYHWFTTMFYYFRHNTATWKNAVRHNLSLHKCFVRVEGGKGAVWTVDEAEFQKRKGQKFTRDHEVAWLAPYSFLCPQETRAASQTGSY